MFRIITCRCLEKSILYRAKALPDFLHKPRPKGLQCVNKRCRLRVVISKGEQASVTILHHEFASVPGCIRKRARDLDATVSQFGMERVYVLNEQICVKEFVG